MPSTPRISTIKLQKSNFKSSPFKVKSPPKIGATKPRIISLKVEDKKIPAIKLKGATNTLTRGFTKLA